MVELGIVDIREIIHLIRNNYNFDYSNFALTSFKYRLEYIIAKNNLSNPESLYRKLADEPEFFDTFKYQLMVPSTEMFRDPSVWRWIREEYFAKLDDKSFMNFKIWLPFCVSGGELYSLCILLRELNLINRVKIFASVFSDAAEKKIKTGDYPLKKIEVSAENYRRFKGSNEFTDYYDQEKFEAKRHASLIQDVSFIKDDLEMNNMPKNIKMIFMRNSMIYFTPTYQDKVLKKIHENLSANGTLIIGLQEMINKNQNTQGLFDAVELNEGIYKKKLG